MSTEKSKMAKKKASKKPTKDQRIAKVKRWLENFTPWPLGKVVKAIKLVTVGNLNNVHVVLLEDGHWSIIRCLGIEGAMSGYNIYALDGVEGLRRFGIITKADQNAFRTWWRTMESEQARDNDLRKAKQLAGKHGYSVRKK